MRRLLFVLGSLCSMIRPCRIRLRKSVNWSIYTMHQLRVRCALTLPLIAIRANSLRDGTSFSARVALNINSVCNSIKRKNRFTQKQTGHQLSLSETILLYAPQRHSFLSDLFLCGTLLCFLLLFLLSVYQCG